MYRHTFPLKPCKEESMHWLHREVRCVIQFQIRLLMRSKYHQDVELEEVQTWPSVDLSSKIFCHMLSFVLIGATRHDSDPVLLIEVPHNWSIKVGLIIQSENCILYRIILLRCVIDIRFDALCILAARSAVIRVGVSRWYLNYQQTKINVSIRRK